MCIESDYGSIEYSFSYVAAYYLLVVSSSLLPLVSLVLLVSVQFYEILEELFSIVKQGTFYYWALSYGCLIWLDAHLVC